MTEEYKVLNTDTKTDTNLSESTISMRAEQPSNAKFQEVLKNHGFSKIRFIGEGWSSEAYNAEYNDKDCIIRIPKPSSGGFETYQKEHAVLEIIADKIKSVAIPRTRIYEGDGIAYVVHEKINGNKFNISSFEELSVEEQDNFSQSVANFFSELHAIDISEFSNIPGIRWGKLNTDFLKNDFEKYLVFSREEGWEESLFFSEHEIAALCNFIESVTSLEEPEVLLHRDFYGNNFVVDDKMRLVGVFDFGNASLASRAIDFSYFVKRSDDGIFQESPILKKILSYYQQASGPLVTFNDVANQLRLADAYCFSWLVSTDKEINNNKKKLSDCAIRIKKWLRHYMAENI